MRILFVARHGQLNNDDEGSVSHALTKLGHSVTCLGEHEGHRAPGLSDRHDLLLFFKWDDVCSLRLVRCPRVFWYFDLVSYPDLTLERRNAARTAWMARTIPNVDLGFCTDGDWVRRDSTGKLVQLLQGADERAVGRGAATVTAKGDTADILFTGICAGGGVGRTSFVNDMTNRWWHRFHHVSTGAFGKRLADLIASTKVVVAPDAPLTPRYTSNRIFLALGMEGFLLHPSCQALAGHYTPGEHYVAYHSREELHRLIGHYLGDREARERIAAAGLKRTLEANLYRHRCERLIAIIRERGIVRD